MRKTQKAVQISEELYLDLLKYHLCGLEDDYDIAARIRAGLQAKLDSQVARQTYSDYLTAPTPDQREAARQKYLDMKGIPTEFRRSTTKETTPHDHD